MRGGAEEIYADALEVDSSGREEFLARACGGDASLRAEVDALLRDAEGADTFFDQLTRGAPGAPGGGIPADRAGTQIGPYRLVGLLGRGGFGSVWLAEQERPIRRRVALKLIKRGMDSEEVLARFRAEQQALALMDHPNIARVFEAGTTPDGRPFFAMEMVEGEKITRFCDVHSLSIPERLRLFLQVCAAVNHAHQKGVIHRDLKPSNILVALADGEPVAKVIDFGIVKAIEGSFAGGIDVTRAEQFVGTPAYMSPEQAGGDRSGIDTRTDVYSLGVILYELLVGAVPFDEKTLVSAGREEIRRIIREEEPARPSTKLLDLPEAERTRVAATRKAAADNLPRVVGAELDWIAMKAIEKSKDRRYETTDALGKDVQRYLDNEPVSARPPSAAYLLGKMARRHRALLGAVAVIAAILVAATATSVWLAVRAREAERLADARLAQARAEQAARESAQRDAEAVSDFIVEVFRRPDPEVDGRTVTVARALDTASEKLRSGLSGQPVRLALIQEALAKTYAGLGLYPESLELRKKVLETRRSALGTDNPATLAAMHDLVSMLVALGYYQQARDLGEEKLAVRRRLGASDDAAALEASAVLAANYFRSGDHGKAIAAQKDLLGRLTAAHGAAGPRSVEAARVLADYYRQTGDDKSADEIERGIEPKKDDGARSGPATDSEHHARVNKRLEDMEAQLASIREAKGPQSAETLAHMRGLAGAYYGSDHRGEAIRTQQELVALLRDKLGDEHPETTAAEDDLAFFLWRHNRMGEAVELKKRLIERRTRIFGPEHEDTLTARADLAGWLQVGAGKTAEAQAMLEECVPLMRKVLGASDRRTLNAISNLARSYVSAGRTREGLDLLAECAPPMPDDTFVNLLLANLQLWAGLDDDYNKTRRWMIAYAVSRRGTMRTRPDILERAILIACLAPLENPDQGSELLATLARCDEIRAAGGRPKIFEPPPAWRGLAAGMLYYRAGDYGKAEAALSETLRLLERCATWENTPANRAGVNLYRAMSLLKQGKVDEARQLYAEASKAIAPPQSAEQPLSGNWDAQGTPLIVWLAQREAKALFEQVPPNPANPATAAGAP